jgi:nitrogenase iron protein NifH
MKRFAIYGKGGSGKSTIAANLSLLFSRKGLRTLQIGCDPKRDSTRSLTGGRWIPSVLSMMQAHPDRTLTPDDFLHQGLGGVSCIEAGGPEPGIGCAGRGIVTVFNLIRQHNVLTNYDVILLDVLGDVVCGGFAAPLMHDMASTVVIVVSDNMMSMYAANNIAKAIRRFQRNGVVLAGLVANNVRRPEGLNEVQAFAEVLGTRVLTSIPHYPGMLEAEREGIPLAHYAPDSPVVTGLNQVVEKLLDLDPSSCAPPTPMDDDALDRFIRGQSA